MTVWKCCIAGAMLLFGVVATATADIGLQFGVESFRWREYDAGGNRILEERGPRARLGGEWRLALGDSPQYVAQFRGALYVGRVDYDGQACVLGGACSPYMSETDYVGSNVEATMARRFGDRDGFELFLGGGIDNWRREIKGDTNVQGAVEDWTVFYAVAGAGSYWSAPAARYETRIGVKYPVYTYELPDLYDITLEPKGAPSVFVKASVDFLANGAPRWGLGAYYDSYRFDQSDHKRTGSVIVWQPDSHQDVLGIYFTVYLR